MKVSLLEKKQINSGEHTISSEDWSSRAVPLGVLACGDSLCFFSLSVYKPGAGGQEHSHIGTRACRGFSFLWDQVLVQILYDFKPPTSGRSASSTYQDSKPLSKSQQPEATLQSGETEKIGYD